MSDPQAGDSFGNFRRLEVAEGLQLMQVPGNITVSPGSRRLLREAC